MARPSHVRIILVPYDSGHRAARMGSGLERLLSGGVEGTLGSDGREIRKTVVEPKGVLLAEVATAFELDRLVSEEVRKATESGESPLVLSGNCNACVGTASGAGSEGLGIVWFDAHADFNTPDTTTTGFTDGMSLAIAVGHCWGAMARSVPGFSPVPEENVVLVGTRDVEPAEQERLDGSGVTVVSADLLRERDDVNVLGAALGVLGSLVGRVYVHLDLDVLDPGKVGPANEFAALGGLTGEEVAGAIQMVRERFAVVASGIASYDPAFDEDGAVLEASLACASELAAPDART